MRCLLCKRFPTTKPRLYRSECKSEHHFCLECKETLPREFTCPVPICHQIIKKDDLQCIEFGPTDRLLFCIKHPKSHWGTQICLSDNCEESHRVVCSDKNCHSDCIGDRVSIEDWLSTNPYAEDQLTPLIEQLKKILKDFDFSLLCSMTNENIVHLEREKLLNLSIMDSLSRKTIFRQGKMTTPLLLRLERELKVIFERSKQESANKSDRLEVQELITGDHHQDNHVSIKMESEKDQKNTDESQLEASNEDKTKHLVQPSSDNKEPRNIPETTQTTSSRILIPSNPSEAVEDDNLANVSLTSKDQDETKEIEKVGSHPLAEFRKIAMQKIEEDMFKEPPSKLIQEQPVDFSKFDAEYFKRHSKILDEKSSEELVSLLNSDKKFTQIRLLYSSNKNDGVNSTNFHEKCKQAREIITLAKSEGEISVRYINRAEEGIGVDKESSCALSFSLTSEKVLKTSNANQATLRNLNLEIPLGGEITRVEIETRPTKVSIILREKREFNRL